MAKRKVETKGEPVAVNKAALRPCAKCEHEGDQDWCPDCTDDHDQYSPKGEVKEDPAMPLIKKVLAGGAPVSLYRDYDYGSLITSEDAREYHRTGAVLIAIGVGLALVMCLILSGAA